MSKFAVHLEDPNNKVYTYTTEADDYVAAVTYAMDTAFEEMPDNQFRLQGYDEIIKSANGEA